MKITRNIIAGRKPVIEALKARTSIEKIVLLGGVHGGIIEEIRKLAEKSNIEVSEADRFEFRELASHATTQGVIALVASKKYQDIEELLEVPASRNEKGFLLLLDEIEDPQNLGALIRTAECAGVHGVILPKHNAAPVTSTVVKTSAGATEHMAVAEVTNMVNTIQRLKEDGYWIVGLDAEGGKLFSGVDYSTPVAIVVGSEGRGLRRLVKESCDHLVRIPLRGKIESLNASVAGALVMYEVVRQRTRSV